MRPLREWTLTHWLIAIGVFVIGVLIATVIYVVLQPGVFTPPPTTPPVQLPGGDLPPDQVGSPTFPQSPIEQIPLDQVQGLDTQQGIDQIALGGITSSPDVVIDIARNITNAPNNTINYYNPNTQRFYKINADGTEQKVSNKIFAQIDSVAWAGNGSDAVIEFPDGSNIVYNFETDEQVTLPAHWTEFDFSPDSENLAFKSLALDVNERWLAVSSTTGGSSRRIAHLGNNEDIVTVDWSPNNQVVATYTEPNGLNQTEVYFVGFNQENFPLSKVEGLKFEASWTPTGDNLVYSSSESANNFLPSLWIVDGKGPTIGQNRRRLDLNTWSHKCTFGSSSTMYCGVPSTLPRGAGLIPSIADTIPDHIYKVDLVTGVSSRIAIPETDLNVSELIVNEDETQLFIQDRISGKLKKIQL